MAEYFRAPRYFEDMAMKAAEISGQGNRPILQAAAETLGKMGEKKVAKQEAKAKYETELQDERKNLELKEVFEGLSNGDYARKKIPHPTDKDEKGNPKMVDADFDYKNPMNSVYKLSPAEKSARSGMRNQYSVVSPLYRTHAQNVINAAFAEYNKENPNAQMQPLVVSENEDYAGLRAVLADYDYMPKIAALKAKIAEEFPTEGKKDAAVEAIKDVTKKAVGSAKPKQQPKQTQQPAQQTNTPATEETKIVGGKKWKKDATGKWIPAE